MTTTQTPVDALMELASEAFADKYQSDPADPAVAHEWRIFSDGFQAYARALAAIPAGSDSLGYATQLAQSIFNKHFAHEPHFSSGDVVWRPLDDLLGVLTQIDNMVAGIDQQAGGVPAGFQKGAWRHIEADTICDLIEKHRSYCSQDTETFKDASLHQLLRDVVDAAAAAAPSPSAVQPLSEAQKREPWLCLLCKSGRPDHHGTLDDRVTPCPNAHGIITKEST